MNQEAKNQGLVLIDKLCVLSFFPLLTAYFRLRSARVYYFETTKIGLKIAGCLRVFKIISREPAKIKDLNLADTYGASSILRFEALSICLKNQDKINEEANNCLPGFKNYFRKTCAAGVSKEWTALLQALLFQLNRGRALACEKNIPTQKVILISRVAPLMDFLKADPEFSYGIKVSPQLGNKAPLYSWGPVVYSLGSFIVSLFRHLNPLRKVPPVKHEKPMVGIVAAWGFEEPDKNRVDDFFWWRKSKIPAEQIIYIFERQDFQPTRTRLDDLERLGVQVAALNPKYPGDVAKIEYGETRASLGNSLKTFFFYFKLIIRGLLADSFNRSICSFVGWQIFKSEKLARFYKEKNIKGVLHFDEAGFEFVNLAALQSDVARIGTHWSCFTSPNASTIRCHEVYFVWGEHDLKIILDSGSIAKNILISGCFLSEQSHKEERQKGHDAVQSIKKQGASLTLTLFDNSLPLPNFYRFFLQWLMDDPKLGIVVKSKGATWKSVQKDGLGGLVQQAVNSGRIFVMNEKASPADAALLTDFAVGTTGISAIAVAALQGAKVLYLDYEKLDQGKLKPYGLFHSLGPRRCVFYDPESLKEAVLEYAHNPENNPNLGDASCILGKLDPFRDGKASLRIGEFVAWYLESLDQNLSKDKALKAATDKYAEKWGNDKVIRRDR